MSTASSLQVLAWFIDDKANHWAVVPEDREGPWSWVTQLGRAVSLLSTNLLKISEPPGARIVDVRWSVDSRYPEDAAVAAAAKLGLRPIAERDTP